MKEQTTQTPLPPPRITYSKADGYWLHLGPEGGQQFSTQIQEAASGTIGTGVLRAYAEDLDYLAREKKRKELHELQIKLATCYGELENTKGLAFATQLLNNVIEETKGKIEKLEEESFKTL